MCSATIWFAVTVEDYAIFVSLRSEIIFFQICPARNQGLLVGISVMLPKDNSLTKGNYTDEIYSLQLGSSEQQFVLHTCASQRKPVD